MKLDYAALRKVAEAATPGPWVRRSYVCDETGRTVQEPGVYAPSSESIVVCDVNDFDERFIAAANPDTVLALLDRLEKLERVYKAASNLYFPQEYVDISRSYARLQREIRNLRGLE